MTYTDSNTDLIWQPDIRVSAFPSGLLLVQRSAICRKTLNKRADIAVGEPLPTVNTPEIDGLFIFPEAQERRDPGFITYDVSAYGRTTDVFREVIQERLLGATSATVGGTVTRIAGRTKSCVQSGVILATADAPLNTPAADPVISVDVNGTVYNVTTFWTTTQITRKNFGVWDEVIITWDAGTPESITITP